jgi:molybdopterin converting factor small subunit
MAKIKYFGKLRSLCGKNEDWIAANSLTELLRAIQKLYGKEAKKSGKGVSHHC